MIKPMVNVEMSVTFEQDQIRDILIQWLKEHKYQPTGSIQFKMREVCTGFGMMEEYTTVFDGATVKVRPINE